MFALLHNTAVNDIWIGLLSDEEFPNDHWLARH